MAVPAIGHILWMTSSMEVYVPLAPPQRNSIIRNFIGKYELKCLLLSILKNIMCSYYRGPYAFAATDFKGYNCNLANCPSGDNPLVSTGESVHTRLAVNIISVV